MSGRSSTSTAQRPRAVSLIRAAAWNRSAPPDFVSRTTTAVAPAPMATSSAPSCASSVPSELSHATHTAGMSTFTCRLPAGKMPAAVSEADARASTAGCQFVLPEVTRDTLVIGLGYERKLRTPRRCHVFPSSHRRKACRFMSPGRSPTVAPNRAVRPGEGLHGTNYDELISCSDVVNRGRYRRMAAVDLRKHQLTRSDMPWIHHGSRHVIRPARRGAAHK
jgi:hypothetical protein